jgi:hypothetical protein
MIRTKYYEYIEERLSTLATSINSGGKLNVLNLHNHAENFYLYFLKELFGWNLKNFNKIQSNVEAIDLISILPEKIIIQVSATCTKDKIESALKKKIIGDYKDYRFKFISISKDASKLKKKSYNNPHCISFDPLNDILDNESIKREILGLDIDRQKSVYYFIKKELGQEMDIEKLDSNLASIINILSQENLDRDDQSITINSFEIDRKISFNNLNTARDIINDYNVYHNRLDKIYSAFDVSGVNKSNSVLSTIRREYIKNSEFKKDDELFYLIINNIQEKIMQSANFIKIPMDELELCVNILIVDAFIRCKIFKNPNNYKYVIA